MTKSVATASPWIRLLQIFSARLVLEVFGGAGAIWGFSEAIGLRTPHTIYIWRPTALTFGVIFFVRWCMQINDYMYESGMKVDLLGEGKTMEVEKEALIEEKKEEYGGVV
uniref:Uncharacterized protein n=1 Tax=Chaetoceros debilis TaxID=122233 RepID=A0A7S3QK21_9STRA|mmetsp:Transcript_15621/g.23404  ORF Transcript_15621/g.23404 Transcript_15621/m.23404 type:complete len:110 (-) Transcript_15621:120-449(-)|eukprot:CAMPEP_0194120530 /NCGR_PEP_ID=MMETSP0150-20130528/43795_1 /TAXON_ID=122233 /ORGANISM="Chaetoceros debilis, Strain MM31A-1" /LENGTH=109 /DNA_ID=CAMNT_0038812669 /DNA_START=51 /DNA_END=380 /DNA_ORIENTATION=+